MEAFGMFGFVIGLVAMTFAMLAYSQVAGLKAEVAVLRAEVQRASPSTSDSGEALDRRDP